MITFSILAFIMVMIIGIVVTIATIGGAAMVLVFGDVFICAVIIGTIVYLITRQKK